MKKNAIVLLVSVSAALLLSGCAGRQLNKEDRAAILGASMNQAYQNAHDAAYGEGAFKTKHKHHHNDDEDSDQYGQSAHKHLPKGCTQLQDANGECDAKPAKQSSSFKQLSSEADHVMNKPISDSAQYLLSKGWKPSNGEWHKNGYTLRLVVEDDVVINSQITK